MPGGSAGERGRSSDSSSSCSGAGESPGIPGSWGTSSSGVSGTGGCSVISGQVPAFEVGQAHDVELRRRAAQERANEQELVRVLRRERGFGGGRLGEPRLELQSSGGPARQRANGRDPPAANEERAAETRLDRGRDETKTGCPEPLELGEVADDLLERCDAIAEARGVLVPQALGEVSELGAKPGQGTSRREHGELALGRALQGPRRELRPPAAADRAERGRRGGDHDPVSSPYEIEVPIRTRRA